LQRHLGFPAGGVSVGGLLRQGGLFRLALGFERGGGLLLDDAEMLLQRLAGELDGTPRAVLTGLVARAFFGQQVGRLGQGALGRLDGLG
jgi:hypothetical protein